MRIVSLHPAGTEWLAVLQALDALVARSHACDFPPSVRTLPVVTKSARGGASAPSNSTAAGIYAKGCGRSEHDHEHFEIDVRSLAELRPDLILTRDRSPALEAALVELNRDSAFPHAAVPELFLMRPTTLKHVLNDSLRLGSAIGRKREAMAFVAEREGRLQELRSRLGLSKRAGSVIRPSVLCIEWMDPLVAAGGWVLDMVELAGGRIPDMVGLTGGRIPDMVELTGGMVSAVIPADTIERPIQFMEWTSVRRADPDVLAFMPCGCDLELSLHKVLTYARTLPGWSDLRAVREDRVYVFDAKAYFSRPGPRLYRGIELLALALHPTHLAEIVTATGGEMRKVRNEPRFEE